MTTVKRTSDNATLLTIEYDALGRRITSADLTGASNPDEQCGSGGTGVPPVSTRHVYAGIQAIEEYICCSDDADECDTEDWSLAREFVWGEANGQAGRARALRAALKVALRSDLRGYGALGAGLFFELMMQDARLLELMSTPGTACYNWYTAALAGDTAGMDTWEQRCYDEAVDAGLVHAGLRFLDRCNKK